MARASLLRPFRRSEPGEQPAAPPPRGARRVASPPTELRRERRALLRLREERIRDLGGLALEMYRQDTFRETLLYERCAEIASMEERLRELDVLLEGRRAPAERCTCGAPLLVGSRFCANCGRPARGSAAHPCAACGGALAAGTRFCPSCGTPVETTAETPAPVDG